MAVPPADPMSPTASMIVLRSLVGPVNAPSRPRERRDEHAVLRPQVLSEARGGVADEVDPARHALAAVDQQRKGRRQGLLADQVELLRHTVLGDGEARPLEPADELPRLVVHARFEQHAARPGLLGDLERLQLDGVAHHLAEFVLGLDASTRRSNGFSSSHSTAYGGPSSSTPSSISST